MIDGSLCAMGGLTPQPVRSALRHFPEDFLGPEGRDERRSTSPSARMAGQGAET
jgi:NADH-ubiquinone oxidoreductase-F iron-sulfur binding region